jgi:hypothetical protein
VLLVSAISVLFRYVRKGSSTEIGTCDNEVRFTLELGHRAMLSSQHLFGCAK